MWELFLLCKTFGQKPSEQLFPSLPPGLAYDFNTAVMRHGLLIERMLDEQEQVVDPDPPSDVRYKYVPRWSIEQLLGIGAGPDHDGYEVAPDATPLPDLARFDPDADWPA